jgi:hypothetical protein
MNAGSMTEIWVYLSAQPCCGSPSPWPPTCSPSPAPQGRRPPGRQSGAHLGGHPGGLLLATDTPYQRYFDGAQFVHFLLGPATVALAVPLHGQLKRLVAMGGPLLVALVVGSWWPACRPTPSARCSAQRPDPRLAGPQVGHHADRHGHRRAPGRAGLLTAVFVILTGIFGAIFADGLLRRLGVKDEASIGFALGLASHGIGTARAFQLSEQTGAFAALAMGLNGLFTALTLPWLLPCWRR